VTLSLKSSQLLCTSQCFAETLRFMRGEKISHNLKNAKVIWFDEAKSVTTLRAGWMKSSAHLQTTSKTNSRRIFLRVSMRKHSIVNSLRVAKSLRLTPKICLSMLLKPITIASSGKIFTLCPTKPVTGK